MEILTHDRTPYPANVTIVRGGIGKNSVHFQVESQPGYGIDSYVTL